MQNNIIDKSKVVSLAAVNTQKTSGTTVPFYSFLRKTEPASIANAISNKIYIVKKDGTRESYNFQKIVNAVKKSAGRVMVELSDDDFKFLSNCVRKEIRNFKDKEIDISKMHDIV